MTTRSPSHFLTFDDLPETPLWRRVFYAGTEWESQLAVDEFPWEWKKFDLYLRRSVRARLAAGDYCYIWGATEPKFVPHSAVCPPGSAPVPRKIQVDSADEGDDRELIIVPVLNVVLCSAKVDPRLAIASVQMEAGCGRTRRPEEMHMKWQAAYISADGTVVDTSDARARVFYLTCDVDPATAVETLGEDAAREYQYAQPYALVPEIVEENIDGLQFEEETIIVSAKVTLKSGATFEIDSPLRGMTPENVAEAAAREHAIPAEQMPELIAAVKEALREPIKAGRDEFAAKKNALETELAEQDPKVTNALRGMTLVKVYPADSRGALNEALAGQKAEIVNRFFGRAKIMIEC